MYKNRISRTTSKSHSQFFIRRSEIAFDERLPFIESVLATLIESRFGPGRVEPLIVSLSDRPDLEPAVYYDLSVDGEANRYYALSLRSFLRRTVSQMFEAASRNSTQKGWRMRGPFGTVPRTLSRQIRDAARRGS